MVSAEYHKVPGDQACSFDLLTDRVGSCQMSSWSPTWSTTAVAVSWAITWSTASGRCGPCCSTAPIGRSNVDDAETRSRISGPVSSS